MPVPPLGLAQYSHFKALFFLPALLSHLPAEWRGFSGLSTPKNTLRKPKSLSHSVDQSILPLESFSNFCQNNVKEK